jgi:hypothetical protein
MEKRSVQGEPSCGPIVSDDGSNANWQLKMEATLLHMPLVGRPPRMVCRRSLTSHTTMSTLTLKLGRINLQRVVVGVAVMERKRYKLTG